MPIEYAIPKVHKFLVEEGIRDQITLMASGGLRSAWDVAKAIALGADGAILGTAELVAIQRMVNQLGPTLNNIQSILDPGFVRFGLTINY